MQNEISPIKYSFDKWNVKIKNYNIWQKYFKLNHKTTPNFDHRMGKNIEIINPPGNNMTYFTTILYINKPQLWKTKQFLYIEKRKYRVRYFNQLQHINT